MGTGGGGPDPELGPRVKIRPDLETIKNSKHLIMGNGCCQMNNEGSTRVER